MMAYDDDFSTVPLPQFSSSPDLVQWGRGQPYAVEGAQVPAVVAPQVPLDQRSFNVGGLVLGAGAPRPDRSALDHVIGMMTRAPQGPGVTMPPLTHEDLARYQGDGRIPLNAPPRAMPAGVALDPSGMPRFSDPPNMDNRQIVRGSDGSARTAVATGGVPLALDPSGQPRFSDAPVPYVPGPAHTGGDYNDMFDVRPIGIPMRTPVIDNGANAQRFRPAPDAPPVPSPRNGEFIEDRYGRAAAVRDMTDNFARGEYQHAAGDAVRALAKQTGNILVGRTGIPSPRNISEAVVNSPFWAGLTGTQSEAAAAAPSVEAAAPSAAAVANLPSLAQPNGATPRVTNAASTMTPANAGASVRGASAAASKAQLPLLPLDTAEKVARMNYYNTGHQRTPQQNLQARMINTYLEAHNLAMSLAAGKDPRDPKRQILPAERKQMAETADAYRKQLDSYAGSNILQQNSIWNRFPQIQGGNMNSSDPLADSAITDVLAR